MVSLFEAMKPRKKSEKKLAMKNTKTPLTTATLEVFVNDFMSTYGFLGTVPIQALKKSDVLMATCIVMSSKDTKFIGDKFDRQQVRDVLLNDMNKIYVL